MKTFYYAARGMIAAARTERNMRLHLAFIFYVVVFGLITGLSTVEWAVVLLCIGLVTGAECMNTAIEYLCDEVHPGRSRGIERTKDAAAGAVLACAIVSAIIGCIIFLRISRLNSFIYFCKDHTLITVILLITVPVWIYFIFAWRRKDDK